MQLSQEAKPPARGGEERIPGREAERQGGVLLGEGRRGGGGEGRGGDQGTRSRGGGEGGEGKSLPI